MRKYLRAIGHSNLIGPQNITRTNQCSLETVTSPRDGETRIHDNNQTAISRHAALPSWHSCIAPTWHCCCWCCWMRPQNHGPALPAVPGTLCRFLFPGMTHSWWRHPCPIGNRKWELLEEFWRMPPPDAPTWENPPEAADLADTYVVTIPLTCHRHAWGSSLQVYTGNHLFPYSVHIHLPHSFEQIRQALIMPDRWSSHLTPSIKVRQVAFSSKDLLVCYS